MIMFFGWDTDEQDTTNRDKPVGGSMIRPGHIRDRRGSAMLSR